MMCGRRPPGNSSLYCRTASAMRRSVLPRSRSSMTNLCKRSSPAVVSRWFSGALGPKSASLSCQVALAPLNTAWKVWMCVCKGGGRALVWMSLGPLFGWAWDPCLDMPGTLIWMGLGA
eukprot:366326-Chlamydomonas_euryale.AAC.11